MRPIANTDRIHLLDALRGFALLGILIVNFPIMSWGNIWFDQLGESHWPASIDRWAMLAVHFLFENKFFSLFSFLFGLGFSIQLQKANQEGTAFAPYYLKRQFFLLLIGVLHALLLWPGDFLVLYAVLGSLLLLFRNRKEGTIFKWAVVMWLVPALLTTTFFAAVLSGAVPIEQLQADYETTIAPDIRQHIEQSFSIYPNGNFMEVFKLRMDDTARFYGSMPFWVWNSFAMFLLGLYVGKKNYLRQPELHGQLIDRVLWVCGILGIVGNGLYVWTYGQMNMHVPSWAMVANAWLFPLSVPTMTLFYVALFCKFRHSTFLRKCSAYISIMGKMALTNYIMQSLIINLLVMGFGLGLYGKIPPFTGLLLCIGIWIFQLLLSNFYMSKFKFGPVEWVWRKLTYGKSF